MTRKEFFKKGLLSLGEALMNPVGPAEPDRGERDRLRPPGYIAGRGVVADNERCLAKRGGCFSCLERCPEQAIAIEAGVGVTVDRERCIDCGICEQICPVATKSVSRVSLLDIS